MNNKWIFAFMYNGEPQLHAVTATMDEMDKLRADFAIYDLQSYYVDEATQQYTPEELMAEVKDSFGFKDICAVCKDTNANINYEGIGKVCEDCQDALIEDEKDHAAEMDNNDGSPTEFINRAE
jgi:hypothetical protein